MAQAADPASAALAVPPILRLPDELLAQICEQLLRKAGYGAHDKALASLTTVCKRLSRVAIPIRWKVSLCWSLRAVASSDAAPCS